MTLDFIERLCAQVDDDFWQHSVGALCSACEKLIAVAHAARALMSEDDAKEALAHYNALHILAEKLEELEKL